MSRRVHLAVFASESRLLAAVKECRRLGLEIRDVRSPYPIHGLDELAGVRPSRLPVACFIGGVTGLALAMWFQYWSSATDWPIDVGGKPWDSLPAFAPVAFEVTILLAGLATVFGLLLRSGLVPGRRPTLTEHRVTDDHFVLTVARRDASVTDARLNRLWAESGATLTRDSTEDA